MAKLQPPARGENQCDFLEIMISETLTQAEFDELRPVLAGNKQSGAKRTTRFSGQEALRSAFSTAVVLHDVDEWPAVDEGDGKRPAGHLHITLTLESVSEQDREQLSDDGPVEAALEWTREHRKEVAIGVMGGRTFSNTEYASLLPFPEAPKPFTAVRGISLVREHDESPAGSPLYEVYIRESKLGLLVSVNFRSKLFDSSDALQKVLEQASAIAELGVRKRATEEFPVP